MGSRSVQWAPPSPCIFFRQKNKHKQHGLKHGLSSQKRPRFFSSLELVWFCDVRPRAKHGPVYNCTREKIAKELVGVLFYSTTTDLWSSRKMQPYMSLTVHFINDKWALWRVCLQTAYFPEDHKAGLVAQGLKDALSSWNLAEDQLVCMTTDSGTWSELWKTMGGQTSSALDTDCTML